MCLHPKTMLDNHVYVMWIYNSRNSITKTLKSDNQIIQLANAWQPFLVALHLNFTKYHLCFNVAKQHNTTAAFISSNDIQSSAVAVYDRYIYRLVLLLLLSLLPFVSSLFFWFDVLIVAMPCNSIWFTRLYIHFVNKNYEILEKSKATKNYGIFFRLFLTRS